MSKEKQKIKFKFYNNGVLIKLKNRRVFLSIKENDDFNDDKNTITIQTKRLIPKNDDINSYKKPENFLNEEKRIYETISCFEIETFQLINKALNEWLYWKWKKDLFNRTKNGIINWD